MKIALYKESRPGETRVALTPDAVKTLVADGWQVEVESGAGTLAHFSDERYHDAGASVVAAPTGDVNLRVNAPSLDEAARVVRILALGPHDDAYEDAKRRAR